MEEKPTQDAGQEHDAPVHYSTPKTTTGDEKVPDVLVQAHENDEHIDLGWRSWLVIGLTTFAFAAQIFVTVAIGPNIAYMIRDLGDPALAGWILQAPLLMQAMLSPIFGRLSDILDRKWMVSIPPLIALAGCVVSATATSMTGLIGGGILIGATLPTNAIISAIQSEVLPLKYRALTGPFAYFGAFVGGTAGGLGAGAVTNLGPSGWRYAFWIEAAFHGLTSLGFILFYWPNRKPNYPKMSVKSFLWSLDPIGSFFFLTGSALTLIALNWAGGQHSWSSAHVAAPLTIGLVSLVAFGVYEWKGRDDGLVPHVFFQSGPNFPLSVLALAAEGWILFGALIEFVPQIVLNCGYEKDAWHASVRWLSHGISATVFSVFISWWATTRKDLVNPLWITWAAFFASVIGYAVLPPGQGGSRAQIGLNVLSGFGQAGPLSLLIPMVQFASPHKHLSTATGLAFSGRAIGGAFGSAVLGAIINGHLKHHYADSVSGAAIKAGLPESSVPQFIGAMQSYAPEFTVFQVPGVTPTIAQVAMTESHWAYARAYHLAWWSVLPITVVAMGTLAFLRNVKELMTEKIEATVEKVKVKESGP